MLTGNLSKENVRIYLTSSDDINFYLELDDELLCIVKRKAIWPNNVTSNNYLFE